MKKNAALVATAAIIIGIFATSYPAMAQTASPGSASKTSGKTNIAVINMKNASGVTAGEIEVITDRLRGELFNTGKVNVMERDQMQEILKEQGFQQSGACTNEECMVQIGQLLGVEQLVTGSLGKVGSMFLVNLRIIDVKTAKITKVVSEDIKGDIEEVVGRLPGIAAQLVGLTAAVQKEKPVEVEKKEEPKKEEKQVAVEEKKEEAAPEVVDEKAERNKNRFGIRVGASIFGIKPTRIYHLTEYDTTVSYDLVTRDTTYNFDANNTAKITRMPLVDYFVKFILKAGQYVTIEIGGGYSRIETDYEWTDIKRNHMANVFTFPSLGVNFVKRWYPLKLNVGILADFNILDYTIDYFSWDYNYGAFTKDTTLEWIAFNGGFGARAGLEIMAGKHVGFNVDFVYYYSEFVTLPLRYETTDSYGNTTAKNDRVWDITMPPIAVSLGVNFYF
ncbi:MAG TPA: CsgG/HfaB family protein [Chitinivibrionales bacterium]|nr:CsgG/HfaB family protein [Chitinivibrionales bacterium]